MDKQRFKNLSHAFRWMRRSTTVAEALAWVGFYNPADAALLRRVYL